MQDHYPSQKGFLDPSNPPQDLQDIHLFLNLSLLQKNFLEDSIQRDLQDIHLFQEQITRFFIVKGPVMRVQSSQEQIIRLFMEVITDIILIILWIILPQDHYVTQTDIILIIL